MYNEGYVIVVKIIEHTVKVPSLYYFGVSYIKDMMIYTHVRHKLATIFTEDELEKRISDIKNHLNRVLYNIVGAICFNSKNEHPFTIEEKMIDEFNNTIECDMGIVRDFKLKHILKKIIP